jgi:hypothetical protein
LIIQLLLLLLVLVLLSLLASSLSFSSSSLFSSSNVTPTEFAKNPEPETAQLQKLPSARN